MNKVKRKEKPAGNTEVTYELGNTRFNNTTSSFPMLFVNGHGMHLSMNDVPDLIAVLEASQQDK